MAFVIYAMAGSAVASVNVVNVPNSPPRSIFRMFKLASSTRERSASGGFRSCDEWMSESVSEMPVIRSSEGFPVTTTKTSQDNAETLLKVIDEHYVAAHIADHRVEDPAAIGRDRQAAAEILVHFKNWPHLLGCEIKIAH